MRVVHVHDILLVTRLSEAGHQDQTVRQPTLLVIVERPGTAKGSVVMAIQEDNVRIITRVRVGQVVRVVRDVL